MSNARGIKLRKQITKEKFDLLYTQLQDEITNREIEEENEKIKQGKNYIPLKTKLNFPYNLIIKNGNYFIEKN